MNKDKLLKEFRKQCERDLSDAKEKFSGSDEFIKGMKRGIIGAELTLRQLLREMKGQDSKKE